jgi:hypothetical protein
MRTFVALALVVSFSSSAFANLRERCRRQEARGRRPDIIPRQMRAGRYGELRYSGRREEAAWRRQNEFHEQMRARRGRQLSAFRPATAGNWGGCPSFFVLLVLP